MNGVGDPWFVLGMKMGMQTTVKTTCARVILMALTGDGSMSTNCCTELRVWRTHINTTTHPRTHAPKSSMHKHTDTQIQGGVNGKKVQGKVLAKVELE